MLLTVYEIVNDCEHFFLQDSYNFQHKKTKFTIKKKSVFFLFSTFSKISFGFQKWQIRFLNDLKINGFCHLFTDSSLILKNLLFVSKTLSIPYYLK